MSAIYPAIRPAIGPAVRGAFNGGFQPSGFNPRALFSASEPGAWYDPSDMSTMYQDAAGTTPCYQPGQGQVDPPVGLLLDKRLGLERGPERLANGDFSGGTLSWSVTGQDATHIATFSGGQLRYQSDTTTPVLLVSQPGVLIVGKWYIIEVNVAVRTSGSLLLSGLSGVSPSASVFFNPGVTRMVLLATATTLSVARNSANVDITVDSISVRELPGNHAYQTTTTNRPTLSARYNQLTGTESLATQSVPVVATTYVLKTAGPGSVTLSGAASGTYMAGSRIITCTAGALTLTVLGSVTQADLRPANDGVGLPPYQRVDAANTYDTAGFPLYLRFDGVDDWLQTAAVDFSGTDVVAIATAYRKMSDVSIGEVFALSGNPTGNTGTFGFYAPEAGGGTAASVFFARGASSIISGQRLGTAPISCVAGGWASLSMPYMRYRINQGASVTSSVATGGGNYGNYPLFIGRRNGTSYPFNGRLYSLLIRGAATPDATIDTVESYLNSKARIY